MLALLYTLLMNRPLSLQFDVTQIIEGHSSYLWKTKQILEQLELDYFYPVFNSTHSKSQKEKGL
jgi:hypothetical protein